MGRIKSHCKNFLLKIDQRANGAILKRYKGYLIKRQKRVSGKLYVLNGRIFPENYDHYSFTTALLGDVLAETQSFDLNLLSVGGRVQYLVPMLPFFKTCIHSTMIPITQKEELSKYGFTDRIKEVRGDFFAMESDENLQRADIVISHETVHCMNDTRYGNRDGQALRSYKFAEKVSEICPNARYIIVSVPVNEKESVKDNSVVLSDGKFIESFVCGGGIN